MSGITSQGFSRPRLADIKTEIENTLKASFGAGINLAPESVFGQLVGIFAEREDLVWQGMQDVYASQYPDTAFGVSLDNVAALTGTQRIPARPALVTLTLTGTFGTVVPAGSIVAVVNGGPQFETLQQVTIPLSGTVDVAAQSVETGLIMASAGTITEIITPINGWSAVTNALDAAAGNEVETDAALRARRRAQLQKAGAATVEAIRARLLTVAGVTQAIVFENEFDIPDLNGLPPHSFAAYVEGGDTQDIADAIWAAKAGGIQSHGSIATPITDSQGLEHIINWSRPIEKDVYVIVNVTKDPNKFPANGATLISDALVAYGAALQVGDPVIVVPAMVSAIAVVPGILNAEILVGLAPGPTLSNNIVQQLNELAKFDPSRIMVNVA